VKPSFRRAITRTVFFLLLSALTGCSSLHEGPAIPSSKNIVAPEGTNGRFISRIYSEQKGADSTVIRIVATEPFRYLSYMTDKHRRLVIDIEDMSSALSTTRIPVNSALVDYIIINSSAGMVRVENILKIPGSWDLKMEGPVLSATLRPRVPRAKAAKPGISATAQKAGRDIFLLKSQLNFLKDRVSMLEKQVREISGNTVKKDKGGEPHDGEKARPVAIAVSAHEKFFPGIFETLESWRRAWQDRNLERYGKFYARSFSHKGKDRGAWLVYKERKFRKAGNLSIRTEKMKAVITGNHATVRFVQLYKSDAYGDVGTKTLFMTRGKNGWQIEKEDWKAER